MKKSVAGFTLIELLIVVAIIAILAAIAVPNFLEAQVRAKVSRVQANLRAMATALEAYATDYNQYPIYFHPQDGNDFGSNVPEEVTFVPILITTPVAYMTSLLSDPFPIRYSAEAGDIGENANQNFTFLYRRVYGPGTLEWAGPGGTPLYDGSYLNIGRHVPKAYDSYHYQGWYFDNTMVQNQTKWLMGSPGPSLSFPTMQRAQAPQYASTVHPEYPDLRYDPTNGTMSKGDILRFGP